MKGINTSVDSAFCPEIIRYLRKDAFDYIFISVIASFTGILAAAVLRAKGIGYFYEGDGGFAGPRKGIKAFAKRFVISGAEWCFSTSKQFDKYCMTYGAKKENIVRYPFSSTREENVLKNPLSMEEKETLKESLGIREKYYIISVGSFIRRKGMDILIKACAGMPDDWGLYIIGGNPTQEFLILKEKFNLGQLHFVDFRMPEVLRKYYCAADLFVHAAREDIWGLVINEAMACGLPVITTDRCAAGTELVEDGVNGYIVPVEDTEALRGRLWLIMENELLREKMSWHALRTVKGHYTIEAMVDAHRRILEEKVGSV